MEAVIHNYQEWISEINPEILLEKIGELLNSSGYEILNFIEHYFDPKGYTCVWLLAESHLAIHTFPEKNKTYIELSSCNKDKNEKFKLLLPSFFYLCQELNN